MYAKELKVQTSLRIDKTSLADAKEILNEVGMNFSEAVNIFTKMIVKHKGLPFEVKIPNDENNNLTRKLYLALEEVARLERGEKRATNARDFLDEL
jgi:DNA-damage-inducible protein J